MRPTMSPNAVADRESAADGPCDVDDPPAPSARAQLVQSEQSQSQHDEGERGSVVQSALAGEPEAQAIAIVGVRDLHIRGEYRIGRRQDRAEQHGGAQAAGRASRRRPA